jgi:hypothetical protein
MSRKYPRKVRKQYQARLKAAEAFVESWTTSGLAWSLITDYSCTLGCEEAETFAGLFRSFGYDNTAETILADHGEDCDTPHYHSPQDVWTFTLLVFVRDSYIAEWAIVADGKNGMEAEERAKGFLRNSLKPKYEGYIRVEVGEVESGVPAPTALYSWTDIREGSK